MDLYYEIYEKLLHVMKDANRLEIMSLNLLQMRQKKLPNCIKLDYVYELLKEYKLLEILDGLEEAKNDAKSEEYRQQGNSYFSLKSQKYVEALKAYNKSICYAESQENLAIGLANRSAVLCELKMFPECLESIRLARAAGAPDRLREKLERREEKCQQEELCEEEALIPKIEIPVNEKIPFLARCLSLKTNKQFGRYVITEKDIPAGTVIAMEEPFAKILINSEKYLRCANCLQEVPHLLMPCTSCTQTMFCSKVCQEEAQRDFHHYECEISRSLFEVFDQALLIVIRTVIKAFCAFPDPATMAKEIEIMDKEQKTVFSFDWSGNVSSCERYTPIHTLATNENLRGADDLFKKYTFGCLMYHILHGFSHKFRERFLTSHAAENTVKNLIFRHLQTASTNMHSIHVIEDTANPDSSTDFGVAAYAFHSLVNHSCSPNVTRISVGAVSAMITIKNIKAGEQVLDNYGYHHSLMERHMRQKETKRRYHFVCQCTACQKDYPLYSALSMPINIPEPLPLHNQTRKFQYSREFAEKGFKKVVDFIREFSHLYPIMQLCCAEEGLKFCFNILCGKIPLHLREQLQKIPK
ncbi:uncharacterized protein DMENIID0001_158860 [Sergentomyia squamirostris]